MSELPDQPEGIADDSHDLPSLEGAAERVLAFVSNFGDGVVETAGGTGQWWTDREVRPLYARDLVALAKAAQGDR